MKMRNSPLARTPPANLPVIPGVTAPKDANRKSPEKEHKESDMTHHLSTVTGVHFANFLFIIFVNKKLILQSLPKRKRKWINLTWTFKASVAPSAVQTMFQINQMQTTTLQKNLQKNPQKNSSIIFCLMYYYYYSYLLLYSTKLFVHKKVREEWFLIANTQSMLTAKKLYYMLLEVDYNNTCVFMRLCVCRHLLCRVKNESWIIHEVPK